ncbi:M23 family metallopeptidase [Alphaproteobacteria bacterium]|nr:M23 family metallopeptidase [Alphaproteobacteria bacterium]
MKNSPTIAYLRELAVAGVLGLFLLGCGQIASGKWYDTQQGKTGHWWLDNAKSSSGSSSAQRARLQNGPIEVRRGDTYYKLAQRHKVSMRALMDANKARPPYQLEPGDRLAMPRKAFYTVRANDTLYSISRQFSIDLAEFAEQNKITKPFTISVGQTLQVPNGQTVARSTAVASKRAREIAAAPTPSRAGRFIIPVSGPVLSEFGPKQGGLHNDGINISASYDAPIKAAENGVVVYTGNQLRGYGNLLLVRHSGGWVSAYAHTSKFLVKAGDKVQQGDVIAQVGQSGNVERPQLHFELRKGTRAVDPKSLI